MDYIALIWVTFGFCGFGGWMAQIHRKKYKISIVSWVCLYLFMIITGVVGWLISLKDVGIFLTPSKKQP